MDTHSPMGSVSSEFERALRSNGEALSIYSAMGPEERKRFRQKAEQTRSREELKELVNELVGWKTGHGPYQL